MGIFLTSRSIFRSIDKTLTKINREIHDASQKLAEGTRVLGAKDDSGAVSLAAQLKSQSHGADLGLRHAMEMTSAVETAVYAMEAQSRLMLQMQDLALLAVDPEMQDREREKINAEYIQLSNEFDRIAQSAKVAHQYLKNGQFGTQYVQAGAQREDRVPIHFDESYSSHLGYHERAFVEPLLPFTIEASDDLNQVKTGSGPGLRQLVVQVDKESPQFIDLNYDITAKELQHRLNQIDGVSGISVDLMADTGKGFIDHEHPSEVQQLQLKFTLDHLLNPINENGQLDFRWKEASGNVHIISAQFESSNILPSAADIFDALHTAFENDRALLKTMGLRVTVSKKTGDITVVHDPSEAPRPSLNLRYESKNMIFKNDMLSFRVTDGVNHFDHNPLLLSSDMVSMDAWMSPDASVPFETLSFDLNHPAVAQEKGDLVLMFQKMSPDGVLASQKVSTELNATNTLSTYAMMKTALEISLNRSGLVESLNERFGITLDVQSLSGKIAVHYDGDLDYAPKIYAMYKPTQAAAPGVNESLDLKITSDFQTQSFAVKNGEEEESTFLSRLVPSTFVPSMFQLDFSQARINNKHYAMKITHKELHQELDASFSSVVRKNTLGGTSIDTLAHAEKALAVIQESRDQLYQQQADADGNLSVLNSVMDLSAWQKTNYDTAYDRVMDVDMASELARLAKYEMLQDVSLFMIQQAMRMGANALYYFLD